MFILTFRPVVELRITNYLAKILLLCALSFTANAATRTTIVTEIQRDDVQKRTEIITIDGDKARIDTYPNSDMQAKNVPYILTVDGGKTWLLQENKAENPVCTKWDTREFFIAAGQLLHFASKLTNAEVSEAKFDVVLDEPGPEMLGYKTRHLQLVSSINAKVKILLLVKREFTLTFEDEIWMSPELKLHPIEQAWIDAMSETGYANVDRLSKQWNEKVPGTVVKMISDVTLHNVTKDKKDQKKERVEITKLEQLESADLPAETFKVPACDKVSESEMEKAAKDMLLETAK